MVNVTVYLDDVEQYTGQAKVTETDFKATSFTSTGTHTIRVKVGNSYTRTREVNFDNYENNGKIIFEKNT